MTEYKLESEELHLWLRERMKESDFTAGEVAEFTKWLMARSCDQLDAGHRDSSVSFVEVVQLVTWIKGRMSNLFVVETERREFTLWLKDRLAAHTCLSEDDMQRLHKEFFDDLT